jgi:hypothetical protein
VDQGEALFEAIADLARVGAAEPLQDALAELTRSVARERDLLGTDSAAGPRLHALQERLAQYTTRFEAEQQRLRGDLRQLQSEIQARARYTPMATTPAALDRRG